MPMIWFQSTHPRRVWHRRCNINIIVMSFNPHTHAGCDEEVKNANKVDRVSIHTPTQGVTIPPSPYCREILFQSTHPRRVWLLPVIAVTLIKGFNPHTHAGCDISNLLYKDIPVEFQSTHPRRVWQIWRPPIYNPYNVSIHTPTQGVTPAHGIYHWQTQSFNPHTHAGCDMFFGIIDHTHQGFNPHTHAGCDAMDVCYIIPQNVSIHTPTQGVTLYLITYYKSANLIHCYANHHYYSTS